MKVNSATELTKICSKQVCDYGSRENRLGTEYSKCENWMQQETYFFRQILIIFPLLENAL